MTERNTELQPHEYKPSKMEGVITSVKNLSAEKIDLVIQKLTIPMQQDRSALFFLRFWRLAEGAASVQEIPMSEAELFRLGLGIFNHLNAPEDRKALPVSGDHPNPSVADRASNQSTDTTRYFPVINAKKSGRFNAWMKYKGEDVRVAGLPSVCEVLHALAEKVRIADGGAPKDSASPATDEVHTFNFTKDKGWKEGDPAPDEVSVAEPATDATSDLHIKVPVQIAEVQPNDTPATDEHSDA